MAEPTTIHGDLVVEGDATGIGNELTGVLVELDGSQSIPDASRTEIAWGSEFSRGGVSGALSNNRVVVPSGYDYAKVTVSVRFASQVSGLEELNAQLNGSGTSRGNSNVFDANITCRMFAVTSGWAPVSEGDEIGAVVKHTDGASADLEDEGQTFMDVEFR